MLFVGVIFIEGEANFPLDFTKKDVIICILVGLVFFILFLVYIWRFTVDDAYISFRYALNLAEGHGLVWNIGEVPIEGYSNFLWVIIMALVHLLKLDPTLISKIIGLSALAGNTYLYWKIAKDVFEDKRLYYAGFTISTVFLLINPATAIHAVSGLETMLYTTSLLLVVYCGFKLFKTSDRKYYWFFPIALLISSFLRPEGILISIGMLILFFMLFFRKLKIKKINVNFLLPFLVYSIPILAYMIFQLYYFHDIFPLPFYVKTISGSVFSGLYRLSEAIKYIAPFIIVILINVVQSMGSIFYRKEGQFARFRMLLMITTVLIFFATMIYPFSSLYMNYAQRLYYPSFVIIYLLTAISLVMLFAKLEDKWVGRTNLKRYSKIIGLIVVILILSSNINFASDIEYLHKTSNRFSVSYINIGNELNKFSDSNITLASVDSGSIPYFSRWNHVDMVGLNDKFIAKNGVATLEYIERKNPQLIIFISTNKYNPGHSPAQDPFIEFVEKRNYVKLSAVRYIDGYYLIPFLDPNVSDFDKIKAALERASENSFK